MWSMVSQVGPHNDERRQRLAPPPAGSADQAHREGEAHVRRIEQRAVAAVVDEQLVAAPGIDAHDQRLRLRHQRAARLAHQPAVVADRQLLDAVGMARMKADSGAGALVRVDRRKAAAHVEPVEHHARLDDQLADLAQRRHEGVRRRRLRADVEGDAELLGRLPRLDQQARGLGAGDAVLALERDLAVLGRNGDTHPQGEIAAAAGLLGDLLQLLLAVEREAAHAELGERAPDGGARLDRMHEVQLRAGDGRRVLDLGQRGDVEMADARAVKRAQQEHRAVRLVGVGDVTGEVFEEPPGRPARCVRDGGR